jgi:hypothetical protein
MASGVLIAPIRRAENPQAAPYRPISPSWIKSHRHGRVRDLEGPFCRSRLSEIAEKILWERADHLDGPGCRVRSGDPREVDDCATARRAGATQETGVVLGGPTVLEH